MKPLTTTWGDCSMGAKLHYCIHAPSTHSTLRLAINYIQLLLQGMPASIFCNIVQESLGFVSDYANSAPSWC
jgi:hypothetical protein